MKEIIFNLEIVIKSFLRKFDRPEEGARSISDKYNPTRYPVDN